MYTVMDDDAGHYLRATATYTDGEHGEEDHDGRRWYTGAGRGHEPGMVTLWDGDRSGRRDGDPVGGE